MTDSDATSTLEPDAVSLAGTRRRPSLGINLGPLSRRWDAVLRRAPWLWPYGGLALLLAVVMYPAWITTSRIVLSADTLIIHYPWFVLWRDQLAAGHFPFWNPYTFGGFPAFATSQSGFGYPPHWALTWLPPIAAINWTVGLHIMLAGLAAAWCAGRMGASKEGQFLAGAVFALGSATTARMWAGHLSFFEAIAWLPLATGLACEINKRHRIWLLAVVVALMTLAAQPEVTIFAAWWLPLFAVLGSLREGPRASVRALVRIVIGFSIGLGLAAFLILPTMELRAISNRPGGLDWDFRTAASLPLWHVLELINPTVFGEPRANTYWPGQGHEWHERLLYIGFVPLVLAGFARGRWGWICWLGAGVAIALAFGRYVPWYSWTDLLPGYTSFRIPSKHLELAALALSLAAGLGVQRLVGRGVAAAAIAGALVLLVASFTTSAWLPSFVDGLGGPHGAVPSADLDSLSHLAANPLRYAAGLLVALGLLALWPSIWSRRAVVAIAVIEVFFVLQPFRIHEVDPVAYAASEGSSLQGVTRGTILRNGALAANQGPVIKVTQPGGYTSLFSGQYMGLLVGFINSGVALDAAPAGNDLLYLMGYARLVDRDNAKVMIIEPPPRLAWVSHCVWPGQAFEVRAKDFPLQSCITRKTATVREAVKPSTGATIVEERAGNLKIDAEGPGWLLTVQPWYPGWQAHIDGVPAHVEAVDGALVGVELPPGKHTVALAYWPAGLDEGIAVTVMSLILLVGLWRWERGSLRMFGRTFGTRSDAPGSSR